MKQHAVQDVSALPTTGFGSSSPIWWGTLGFVALEGMGFALAAGTYLYLRQVNPEWPIAAPPPNHRPGTLLLILLLISLVPNAMADRVARQQRLRAVQFWLIAMTGIAIVALFIRAWEFANLNVQWDENAYGSITWFVL